LEHQEKLRQVNQTHQQGRNDFPINESVSGSVRNKESHERKRRTTFNCRKIAKTKREGVESLQMGGEWEGYLSFL